jgi:hypothetical protein
MYNNLIFSAYLSGWHDMQQQITDDRTRARHLLHISQEIIKLKLRLDDEISRINPFLNPSWFDNSSLSELKHRIYYEIELDKENRQVKKTNKKKHINILSFFE